MKHINQAFKVTAWSAFRFITPIPNPKNKNNKTELRYLIA